ncbi:MAG: hypothetical protein GOP50_12970 [Candidatus Heimdallarchaeota archaeon]|nr:hypothetical protein [Candidatus Heimdallarchaeota archaeon]
MEPQILSTSLIPHDPIVIYDDDTFDSFGFSGNGSEFYPYLIENLLIETSGIGIEIKDTTRHFIIQHCSINSTDRCIFINSVTPGTVSILNNFLTSSENSGISIWNGCHESVIKDNVVVSAWTALDMFNCDYSEIKGNYFANASDGIYIEESDFCVILDNTCFNNEFGIFVAFSTYVTISNNQVLHNTYEGIATDSGDNSLIMDNYCAYNNYGIFALLAANLDIVNNTLVYNNEGLNFEGCDNADIRKNRIHQNTGAGISLSHGQTTL